MTVGTNTFAGPLNTLPGAEVEAADGRALLDELHGKGVVDKDLENGTIALADKQTLTTCGTAHHFDIADKRIRRPLAVKVW